MQRNYSSLDRFLSGIELGLRSICLPAQAGQRENPGEKFTSDPLTAQEKLISGRLMRVNHAGEIAAQGLYQGQALLARENTIRDKLEQAAAEEWDHLNWCEQRCTECGQHTSRLAPLWYGGSFALGALASLLGDRWSLGFLAETEQQVVRHLQGHIERLPPQDHKSRAILAQMQSDEAQHATTALAAGAKELPPSVKMLMGLTSKLMTKTAFWISDFSRQQCMR